MARTGSKRHLIAIKQNSSSTNLNEYGRTIEDVITVATVKGSLDQLRGQDRFAAEQAYGTATHVSEMWFVPGITNKMWIEANGKRYNIVNVENVEERSKELVLTLNSESS